MSFTDLPNEMLCKIASNLTYHELAQCRLINLRFKEVCELQLNDGVKDTLKLLEEEEKKILIRKPPTCIHYKGMCNDSVRWLMKIKWSLCDVMAEYKKYFLIGKCPFIAGKV